MIVGRDGSSCLGAGARARVKSAARRRYLALCDAPCHSLFLLKRDCQR